MNVKRKIKKLQTAIIKNGFIIKINTIQFFSDEQKRMITVYSIITPITYYSEKDMEWKNKDYQILSTCSVTDTVFCLLDIYNALTCKD